MPGVDTNAPLVTNYSIRVRCERDGHEWDAVPQPHTYREEYAKEDNYAYPVRVINCPKCGRGYFQETDGRWMSDRPLTVITGGLEIEED